MNHYWLFTQTLQTMRRDADKFINDAPARESLLSRLEKLELFIKYLNEEGLIL